MRVGWRVRSTLGEKLYAGQMLKVFILRPQLGIQNLRNCIDKCVSNGQFVGVREIRCGIGNCTINRDLLEFGKSSQCEFAAGQSMMQDSISTDLIANNSRNRETINAKGGFVKRRTIRSGQEFDPSRTVQNNVQGKLRSCSSRMSKS